MRVREDNCDEANEFPRYHSEMISTCCGAAPLGELDTVPLGCPTTGICSDCHDHAVFEKDLEDES